jgi:hypothetical protein
MAESAWQCYRKGLTGIVPKMKETVGPVCTCGRELLRGWWRLIGIMTSFMIFTASVRNSWIHHVLAAHAHARNRSNPFENMFYLLWHLEHIYIYSYGHWTTQNLQKPIFNIFQAIYIIATCYRKICKIFFM